MFFPSTYLTSSRHLRMKCPGPSHKALKVGFTNFCFDRKPDNASVLNTVDPNAKGLTSDGMTMLFTNEDSTKTSTTPWVDFYLSELTTLFGEKEAGEPHR